MGSKLIALATALLHTLQTSFGSYISAAILYTAAFDLPPWVG